MILSADIPTVEIMNKAAPPDDLTGQLLIAMPDMKDPRFAQAVIYLCSHSDEGAMGLIINKPAPELPLKGLLEIGVCEDICMPTVMRIKATLPRSGHQSPEIMQALASEPRRIAAQPACQLGLISDGVRLTARLPRLSMITGPMVAIAEVSDPRVWVSETTLSRDGRQVVATVDFVPPHGAALVFDRSRLRMTVLGLPGQAIEMMGCAE